MLSEAKILAVIRCMNNFKKYDKMVFMHSGINLHTIT